MGPSKVEVEHRVEEFVQSCRRQGMKVTHQRMEIFRELAATEEHPDAETIYRRVSERIPSISFDTVYRTLSTLEGQGFIQKVDPLFEKARYDANMDHHHHFVCTECRMVRDFYSESLDNMPIPPAVGDLGVVEAAYVQVRGVCSICANRKKESGGT